jgi:8-oxo-dGTP pyrophosphatase MutT (NUDIX family)
VAVEARDVIRAAGGVVWRLAPSTEVLLVHRPRYDDWSLPKGKLHRGESSLVAAVREVHEETAVHAALQYPVSAVSYLSLGRPKTVEYWAMRVLDTDSFTPGSEVDDVRWVPVSSAEATLTYPHDVGVVRALRPVSGVVILLRHASAGERGSWPGPDSARPLDAVGTLDAESLAAALDLFRPERLVSASPRRCVATLSPVAARLDLPVEVDTAFDEGSTPRDAADRIRALVATSASTVVCSQRKIIPRTLRLLGGSDLSYRTPKGTGWILPFAGDVLLDAYPLS